uniref:Phosphoglycerate kinase n=1 Tax=Gouania willdenowi TaxID=441366 RepID=A0A8C5GR81_GOUWI
LSLSIVKLLYINVRQKKVVLRLDLNVPLKDGVITDTTRIEASLKTLNYLIKNKAKIIILSHLSRIKSVDEIQSNKKSLKVVAEKLQEFLPKTKIIFEPLNVNPKLKKFIENDAKFPYGTSLGDIFVNDAFGTCHRAHASNVGIGQNIKESCIGFLIQNELKYLNKLINSSKKPFVAVLGGAKVEDKVKIIEKIAKVSDYVIIGGAMAYPFLEIQGYNIGQKLFNFDKDVVQKLFKKYQKKLILPVDFIVTDNISEPKIVKSYNFNAKIPENLFGVFEIDQFANGTKKICKAIAKQTKINNSFTLIGGGDSAAAAKKFKCESDFSFISTGGGASIAFIEGSDNVCNPNVPHQNYENQY